jgi:shikimate dehydrogenase
MTSTPRPRACVVGWPVKHSRSPIIHNYWIKTNGLDGAYERLAVRAEEFGAFVETIGRQGLRGANVTLPYKEAAFAACGRVSDAAKAIGAVNTLWREGGALCGDNTDAYGFLANVDAEVPSWQAETKCAVVLGAGGAARAILFALLSRGVEMIVVHNRTLERARRLAEAFGPRIVTRPWEEAQQALAGADLLVNTTSLGMQGYEPLWLDIAALRSHAIVADLNYVPLHTDLIERAARQGLRTVSGLGMLLHQAVPGFERWFGARPIVTAELRALVEADIKPADKVGE